MKKTEFTNTPANTNSINKFMEAVASKVQSWWENINDPRTIRQKMQPKYKSVPQRLKEALIAAIITGFLGVMLLWTGIDYQISGNPGWVGYEIFGVIAVTVALITIEYRRAVAESKAARIKFERRLRYIRDNLMDNVVLLLSKLIKLILVIVTISVALQYVPGLEQYVPRISEASKWIIEIFNVALEKAIVFFKNNPIV